MVDSSSTTDPLTQQKETMVDEESGDGDDMKDENTTIDSMDFELSLFPASSVFGNSYFQKLKGMLVWKAGNPIFFFNFKMMTSFIKHRNSPSTSRSAEFNVE